MHFNIITLFPEMFPGTLLGGVVGRALGSGLWSLDVINMRDFGVGNYKAVDDEQFGGGAGQVIMPDVIAAAIDSIPDEKRGQIIYFSPRGVVWNQKMAREFVISSPPVEGCGNAAGWFSQARNSQRYYNLPFNPDLTERAKENRKSGSLPEALFWNQLKNKQLLGLDFDRQKIIGNYIVDFFCASIGLVIEIDDKTSHEWKENYDEKRDEYLKSLDLEVIHISAESVLKNPADAAKYLENKIQTWLNHPAALPHPSTGGELNYTLICGRYEGIDQRVIDAYNMLEISIGDYVLSGGEVAAQVFVDSCVRLCDNVVGGGSAATENESFEIGGLEWPLYTRPSVWRGQSVPEVLLSGHHGNIERWRKQQSDAITKERRPDLIKGNENEHN